MITVLIVIISVLSSKYKRSAQQFLGNEITDIYILVQKIIQANIKSLKWLRAVHMVKPYAQIQKFLHQTKLMFKSYFLTNHFPLAFMIK